MSTDWNFVAEFLFVWYLKFLAVIQMWATQMVAQQQ
jgi:hypothetical protein